MTDEQIVKALEYCLSTNSCEECPICNTDNCGFVLMRNAFDLIERQQAEIEDLREIVFTDRTEAIKKLKAEAIKEFAEKLKETNLYEFVEEYFDNAELCYEVRSDLFNDFVDNLVREMTEKEGGAE